MGMTVVKCLLHRANSDPAVALSLSGRAGDAQKRTADAGQAAVAGQSSDGARRFPEEYDLAVAFLEGGSAYYVRQTTSGEKKAAFYPYRLSEGGYSRELTATATCNMMPYFRSGNR